MNKNKDFGSPQDPLDFTVQIQSLADESVVGTGIVVSADGKIVTCAHVVKSALGVDPRDCLQSKIIVGFPMIEKNEIRTAVVKDCFPQPYQDDVVLLQLIENTSVPIKEAKLGSADLSRGNHFASYGFRRLGEYFGIRTSGTILGQVQVDRKLKTLPVQLDSQNIRPGMSGAPVLDINRNLVVGIVSERFFPDKNGIDDDTNLSWAVDCGVLSFPPFSLPVLNISYTEWVERKKTVEDIVSFWNQSKYHVIGLIGFPNEVNTEEIIGEWYDELRRNPTLSQPQKIFRWNFVDRPNVDDFFESLVNHIAENKIDTNRFPSIDGKVHLIIGLLAMQRRCLLILDGLDVIQYQEDGEHKGILRSVAMRDFLHYFASSKHDSFCLITSQIHIEDLRSSSGYTHVLHHE